MRSPVVILSVPGEEQVRKALKHRQTRHMDSYRYKLQDALPHCISGSPIRMHDKPLTISCNANR